MCKINNDRLRHADFIRFRKKHKENIITRHEFTYRITRLLVFGKACEYDCDEAQTRKTWSNYGRYAAHDRLTCAIDY